MHARVAQQTDDFRGLLGPPAHWDYSAILVAEHASIIYGVLVTFCDHPMMYVDNFLLTSDAPRRTAMTLLYALMRHCRAHNTTHILCGTNNPVLNAMLKARGAIQDTRVFSRLEVTHARAVRTTG